MGFLVNFLAFKHEGLMMIVGVPTYPFMSFLHPYATLPIYNASLCKSSYFVYNLFSFLFSNLECETFHMVRYLDMIYSCSSSALFPVRSLFLLSFLPSAT